MKALLADLRDMAHDDPILAGMVVCFLVVVSPVMVPVFGFFGLIGKLVAKVLR